MDLLIGLSAVSGIIGCLWFLWKAFKEFMYDDNSGVAFLYFIIAFVVLFVPLIIAGIIAKKTGLVEKDRKRFEMQIEAEKYKALHPEEFSPWERKYMPYACPYCRRYTVRYSNWDDKKISVAFWGVYGSEKIDQQYKCDSCNKMW